MRRPWRSGHPGPVQWMRPRSPAAMGFHKVPRTGCDQALQQGATEKNGFHESFC